MSVKRADLFITNLITVKLLIIVDKHFKDILNINCRMGFWISTCHLRERKKNEEVIHVNPSSMCSEKKYFGLVANGNSNETSFVKESLV